MPPVGGDTQDGPDRPRTKALEKERSFARGPRLGLRLYLGRTYTEPERRNEAMSVYDLQLAHRHHEELVREAENERLARRLREERRRRPSRLRSRRTMAGLGRAMGLWGRIAVPFFRA